MNETCYKIVQKRDNKYYSIFAGSIAKLLEIEYRTIIWNHPHADILATEHGILCYKQLEDIIEAYNPNQNPDFLSLQDKVIFKAIGRNIRRAPSNAIYNVWEEDNKDKSNLHTDVVQTDKVSLELLLNNLHARSDHPVISYDYNSYMCDAIRLIKIIKPEDFKFLC